MHDWHAIDDEDLGRADIQLLCQSKRRQVEESLRNESHKAAFASLDALDAALWLLFVGRFSQALNALFNAIETAAKAILKDIDSRLILEDGKKNGTEVKQAIRELLSIFPKGGKALRGLGRKPGISSPRQKRSCTAEDALSRMRQLQFDLPGFRVSRLCDVGPSYVCLVELRNSVIHEGADQAKALDYIEAFVAVGWPLRLCNVTAACNETGRAATNPPEWQALVTSPARRQSEPCAACLRLHFGIRRLTTDALPVTLGAPSVTGNVQTVFKRPFVLYNRISEEAPPAFFPAGPISSVAFTMPRSGREVGTGRDRRSSMSGATKHTRSIHTAVSLVEETFGDISVVCGGGCERTVSLQKEFKVHALLASRRFESVMADLREWRDQVRCDEIDFDPEREDDFKAALRAFVALSNLLTEKFDIFHRGGLYLAHPKFIGLLQGHQKEAEKILDAWQSPRMEVELRTVKWDKEQTRQLNAILASGR